MAYVLGEENLRPADNLRWPVMGGVMHVLPFAVRETTDEVEGQVSSSARFIAEASGTRGRSGQEDKKNLKLAAKRSRKLTTGRSQLGLCAAKHSKAKAQQRLPPGKRCSAPWLSQPPEISKAATQRSAVKHEGK